MVERNTAYWGEQTRLQRITFRFIPEANARRLALQAGDIDVMVDVHRPPGQYVGRSRTRPIPGW